MVALQSGDTVPRISSYVLCSSMNTQFSLPTLRCGLLQCVYSGKAASLFWFCSHFDINDCCVSWVARSSELGGCVPGEWVVGGCRTEATEAVFRSKQWSCADAGCAV